MTYAFIRYEIVGAAAVITLNRPDKRNAYTPAMRREMEAAFKAAEADEAVRAVVVTGAGRGFCAGADLSGDMAFDVAPPTEADKDALRGEGQMIMLIHSLAKPVIAAINGHAVGAGVAMTLPMDIRIASTSAKFGFAFCRLGFVPEMASAWFLPRLVGPSKAAEWFYTGRTFGPEDAVAAGLVSEVLAPEALLPRALALAEEMAQASPVAVAMTKRMLARFQAFDGPEEALRVDQHLVRARVRSADVKEAMAARVEKRPTIFPDKISELDAADLV
jgi:enoyl-CoA hydratase/carnithine racemase